MQTLLHIDMQLLGKAREYMLMDCLAAGFISCLKVSLGDLQDLCVHG